MVINATDVQRMNGELRHADGKKSAAWITWSSNPAWEEELPEEIDRWVEHFLGEDGCLLTQRRLGLEYKRPIIVPYSILKEARNSLESNLLLLAERFPKDGADTYIARIKDKGTFQVIDVHRNRSQPPSPNRIHSLQWIGYSREILERAAEYLGLPINTLERKTSPSRMAEIKDYDPYEPPKDDLPNPRQYGRDNASRPNRKDRRSDEDLGSTM